MRILLVVGLVAAFMATGWAVHRGFVQADVRVQTVKSWNEDDTFFTTAGFWDSTLVVARSAGDRVADGDPIADRVMADAYLSAIHADRKIVGELKAMGFTKVVYGASEVKL